MPKLNHTVIEAAIAGFAQQKLQIDTQIAELRAMLSSGPTETATATPEATPGKHKKFSAASRRRMALAQKERWAKIRGEVTPPAPAVEMPKPKRKFSAAGRAAIVAANKKMWARRRAAAKAVTKKV